MKVYLFLILFTGCALRVDYKLPVNRFIDPETRGTNILKERSWFIASHVAMAYNLGLSSVSTNLVFPGESLSEDQGFYKSSTLGLQAGLGILPFLDFHYRVDHDSPSMLISKLQLLGTSAKEMSIGHKLALWGGMGSMSDSDSLDVSMADGSNNREYIGDLSVRAYEGE